MEAGANAVDNVAKSVESVGNHIESSSKNLEEGIRSTGDSLKSAARDATILSQIIMGVGLGGMMLLDIGFGIGNCYGSSNNQNLSDRYHL